GEVDAHLRTCPPCHSRVTAERAIRELLQARKSALKEIRAPESLRARCAASQIVQTTGKTLISELSAAGAAGADGRPSRSARWLIPVRSVAVAAALVFIVGGAFLYELTDRSTRVMADQLVADHIKCFGAMNHLLGTNDQPEAIEASLAANIGWRLRLPVQ